MLSADIYIIYMELFKDMEGARSAEEILAEKRHRVMLEIAWMVDPICRHTDVPVIARALNITQKLTNEHINALTESGELISYIGEDKRRYHFIPAPAHLNLLTELRKDPMRRAMVYGFALESDWRNRVRSYVTGEKYDTRYTYAGGKIENTALALEMAQREEWQALFFSLPYPTVETVFNEYYTHLMTVLEAGDEELAHTAFLDNGHIPEAVRCKFRARWALLTLVLGDRMEEIDEAAFPESQECNLALLAIKRQYRGDNKGAVRLWTKALKAAGKPCFLHPLLDTLLAISLMEADTDKADRMLKSMAYNRKTETAALRVGSVAILLAVAQEEDAGAAAEKALAREERYSRTPLCRALTLLVMRHFHLGDEAKRAERETELREMVGAPHLGLLRREMEERGVMATLRIVPKWEKTLAALQEIAEQQPPTGKKDEGKEKGTSQARIIYLVDKSLHITPKLQKSKDGHTWTKGRNIALSTFHAGIPEMGEVDKAMAMETEYVPGYGWGESGYWLLFGPEAVALLEGYPLVFAEDNPTLPVSITAEEAEISVTKKGDGYEICHNLGDCQGSGNLRVRVENDFRMRVIRLTDEQLDVIQAIEDGGDIPKEATDKLRSLLPALCRHITIHSDLLPAKAGVKSVTADPRATILLQPAGTGIKADIYVKPFGEEPPYLRAGEGAERIMGTVGGKRVQTTRDMEAETRNLAAATHLLMTTADNLDDNSYYIEDTERCLTLLERLRDESERIRTEWPEGARLHLAGTATLRDVSLRAGGGIGGWLDVEGEIRVSDGEVVRIGEVLSRLRGSKGRFVEMSEGVYLSLSEDLRRGLRALDSMLTKKRGGGLTCPAVGALLIDEAERSGMSVKRDTAVQQLSDRIHNNRERRYEVPPGLRAELRPYQREGYEWLARLAEWGAGACLADDMGLGKTVQTIALLLARAEHGASLVVVPASVVGTWKRETERFAPALNVVAVNEAGNGRQAAITGAGACDVVVTTYGLLTNEAETLAGREWNVIVLDEAHTIRNRETKQSQTAMTLRGAARVMLTGTPLQNHLSELWTLFEFANPGLLGSYTQYLEKYATPIERDHDKMRMQQLRTLLRPFILRRRKDDVLEELPEKTEITVGVELSDEERALYESLRRSAEQDMEEGTMSAMQALAALTRLRLAACHPRLVDKGLDIKSSKTATFLRLADELVAGGHRALVFSQFTTHLALIREALETTGTKYLYLDGSTPIAERERLVREFQNGETPLFLISLKAGGLGLTLTGADYVIHLDPWWNPAAEDQASDRAYRIGQERRVTVYRLVAEGTIEEKILRLHGQKRSLADAILAGTDAAGGLTREEILGLLKGEA